MEKKPIDKKAINWMFRWIFRDPNITDLHIQAFEKAWGPIHGYRAILTVLLIMLSTMSVPLFAALIGYPDLFVLLSFVGPLYWGAVLFHQLIKACREYDAN